MNNEKNIGLYAGSFSPFHLGHMDIVKQAMDIFDTIVVAQGINNSKHINEKYPLPAYFLNTYRHDKTVYTTFYDTLLIDLIKHWEKDYNVTLIRGLRNGADLEYEQNIVAFLRGMHPQIKIIAFYCDPQYRHISSSALRDIRHFSEEEYNKYIIRDK